MPELLERHLIRPDWPVPGHIHAASTTRLGGVSEGSYASLNLSLRVGDSPRCVAENRQRLAGALDLPSDPIWLRQVHGADVVEATDANTGAEADALVATRPGPVCAILTADCLPVLLADRSGIAVAIAHAGWRGLAAGVIEAAVGALGVSPARIMAWLGPAIGPRAFEVGDDVRQAFLRAGDEDAAMAFSKHRDRWLADLYALAAQRLARAGVTRVYGGGYCTYTESERFFSYRRQGACGRMATLIWIA